MRTIMVRKLGLSDYKSIWQNMKYFTEHRTPETPDELWFTEHWPVFTQGQAGKPFHVLDPQKIPVIQTDRGGQVTYHGPGQIVFYPLIDLRRKNMTPKALVHKLETVIIAVLAEYALIGNTQKQAPGVYIEGEKIASLGLRIRKGCSYHGASLNVCMDLTPFNRIHPCGYPGLKVTQLQAFDEQASKEVVINKLIAHFTQHFDYTKIVELN